MRLGVFGGTFDPVHLAHLILAEQCREQGQLDRVHFIPAARPPHKPQPLTPFHQRVEMLQLAVSGNPAFVIDEIESERDGPSYTVDTLGLLRERHAGADLALIVGSDSLHDLPRWVQPRRILELAEILVVARPDWAIPAEAELRMAFDIGPDFPLRLRVVDVPRIEIASRDLRRRLAEGRSVRYQLPRAVEAYIADKGLYQSKAV